MKDWIGSKKSLLVTIGGRSASSLPREAHDYYATEPRSIDALLAVEDFDGGVWECACGEGHLSKRLMDFGVEVISTDLIDRGFGAGGVDFLKQQKLLAPNIITNPPYKYAKEFVGHAMNLGADKTAMFLKLTFLESAGRQKLFAKYPPKTIAVFARRIHCAINGRFQDMKGNAACYAWFIWVKGYSGNPTVTWCDKKRLDLQAELAL